MGSSKKRDPIAEIAGHKTVDVTHYGRKSGKPYQVKIWFVVIDGAVWIGSLNPRASWVRNVKASGRADLDFGDGAQEYRCFWIVNNRELKRFTDSVLSKYPIMARIIRLLARSGKQIAFRLETPDAPAAGIQRRRLA